MSELIRWQDKDLTECYEAESVDRVLAEKNKAIALLKDKANYNETAYKLKSEELADTCRFYEEEIRRHKYKRCLAMADGCKYLCAHYQLREVYKKRDFFRKWMFSWLAIAENFKEAK